MHIKKVEIFGFKSFGFTNTAVQFEPGLVSISGPNGSGKSNILDAIIFAMGENKPKTMRVDKLRSLIHDIEGSRRGPKIARVSVHFDNSDRKIPTDSDTVEITREMDEQGENIYYLNKKKVLRNQILDLLDVANAGLNQLNAVQQGTVTRISEFTPEEKRQAIENLVGLSYFDEKKTEALKQLDDADRRLEIALAKMGEIKKRIDELEEERNQKLRYDLIEIELNRYNAISAANRMKIIKSDRISKERHLDELTSEVTTFDRQRSAIRAEAEELEKQKATFMDEINAYNQAKSTLESELSFAMQKYEEANSSILASRKRIQQIDTRIPEINEFIAQIHKNYQELQHKMSQINESLSQIDNKRKTVNDELSLLDIERKKILDEQSEAAARKSEIDDKIKKLTIQLNDARLKLSKFESEKEDIEEKLKINSSKYSNFEQEIVKLEELKTRLESLMANHTSTIKELQSRILSLTSKKSRVENDLEELKLILEKSSKAAAQYETKIKTVKGIMHEDYSIAKLKEDADKLGIEGLVYEMISWEKQYERAVLAVSSDWIKAIIVKDFATLLNLADFARSKNLPKLKIIPIEAIPKFKFTLPKDSGVIGVLSSFVKCDPRYSALSTFLFGNVVLTDSQETAHKISKSGYKAVTLNGEFFEARGGGVIIDINSKISNLTKIISMSTSVEGLHQSIHLLKKFVTKKQFILKKIDDSIHGYKDRLSLSEKHLATSENSYGDLKWKISEVIKTKSQLLTRNSELERQKSRLQLESSKQASYIDSLNERISIVEENYASGEQTRIASEISRLNNRKSELESKQTEIMTEYREKSSQLAILSADETKEHSHERNLCDEIDSLINEKHELETRINILEQEKEAQNNELVKLREKEQELISTSGTSMSQLKVYDDKLKTLHEQDRNLTKEISAIERQSDSLTRDLQDLLQEQNKIQKILSVCGFDEDIETFDVVPLVAGLSAELRSLTALNAKAPETYLEVSDGYRSMSTRKNSLEEERNSIVRFIEEIEKDKRQTFLDAFDKVDKEIRHAFSKMTGGNAWLELQNEDDIFNSGISYLIQFPNKPKRESTSISGGEKTLAAIVFVLALQKLKPSPFYLFDEVDAHLDAPNSERLSTILEERSQESQFIMVSLKDSVVQKAKLIYGVYPKNGVSHVVTYKDKRMPSVRTS